LVRPNELQAALMKMRPELRGQLGATNHPLAVPTGASSTDESVIVEDIPALIERLNAAERNNPLRADDPVLRHQNHTTHSVQFYAIRQTPHERLKLLETLHGNAFGKICPLLATVKDGVLIPVIGDFYALERVELACPGMKHKVTIRRMMDSQVAERLGLVHLMDTGGYPYQTTAHSLQGLVGRLSMFPGEYGWVEVADGRQEQPVRNLVDVLRAVALGKPLRFQHTRLEVKAAGAPQIKSIRAVPSIDGHVIIMPTRSSPPNPDVELILIDRDGTERTVAMTEFLTYPGVLLDAYFQPRFWSVPGFEHVDQQRGVREHQNRIRRNGVTAPDHTFFFWEIHTGKTLFPYGDHGLSFRMTIANPKVFRLTELLGEYRRIKKTGGDLSTTFIGRWHQEGALFGLVREFLYNQGCNVIGLNASRLYMLPNGRIDAVFTLDQTVQHAQEVRRLVLDQLRAGNLMSVDEAYNNLLNNDCLDGRKADLAEYGYRMPGSDEFAIKFTLHLLARFVDDLRKEGLLSL
jgi:hypothetical protein